MSFLEELYEDLFPAEAKQRQEAKAKRFVHYTNADVAMSIIKNKKVWMRNTRTMNDFSEIEHGLMCLTKGLNSEAGGLLHRTLQERFGGPGIVPFILKQNLDWFKNNTYITCISEHDDGEDGIGRLSMWRAYGGSTGVALVVKNTPFVQPADDLGAFTFPVTYSDGSDFPQRFEHMAQKFAEKEDAYLAQDWPVTENFYMLLKYLVLCTKHPGFREEREWRVVYTPGKDVSPHIDSVIASVRGTPQQVHLLPLKNIPEISFYGASIPEFIDHLIIGPTSHPDVMKEAFIQLLEDAGVEAAESKVKVSDIPLRHYF